MIKDKQKKKMKMMLNRCSNANANANANAKGDHNNNTTINYYAIDDGDFIVYEILFRLPVKTLMRFKSVSKRWMSSITNDSHFHQLHYDHSETCLPLRKLTISSVDNSCFREITGYQVSDANLINGAAAISYHTFWQESKLFSVHGLVCMLDLPGRALRIYNPSTRQETQWIDIPTKGCRTVFGFDPVTHKHKVLCRPIVDPAASVVVFTVGENSWRRIDHGYDQVPRDNVYPGACVYLNGAIYWMEKISSCKNWDQKKKWGNGAAEVLVAFDVGSEKFRVIPIPDYIINQPRDESYWYVHNCRGPFTDELLEVNGRLALLRRKNKDTASMWMSEDDPHGNWNWTEVVITLPFDWVGEETSVWFDNVPGTDQIMLKLCIHGIITAYYHNWKRNSSKKLDYIDLPTIGNPPRDRSEIGIQTRCTHFRESIFPVN